MDYGYFFAKKNENCKGTGVQYKSNFVLTTILKEDEYSTIYLGVDLNETRLMDSEYFPTFPFSSSCLIVNQYNGCAKKSFAFYTDDIYKDKKSFSKLVDEFFEFNKMDSYHYARKYMRLILKFLKNPPMDEIKNQAYRHYGL